MISSNEMGFKDFIEKLTHTYEDLVKARPQQVRFIMATLKALGTELITSILALP